ncbi:hypothetical protein CHY_1269 [Carboxydothermus hydrogenoformans Z-2901]|uniref:Uncharacterized protein n=1 Tax=Carboxydothermus hydrogenoformans (strain ATCC BAA-161 / DSM 6008 / Z-2901) TaxID=246194 RepID=Q3ACN1_CARHZ|nr:hypothetical protein CHY_1269 [Carboxydothermus hydrogenoformans Z-2901]
MQLKDINIKNFLDCEGIFKFMSKINNKNSV